VDCIAKIEELSKTPNTRWGEIILTLRRMVEAGKIGEA
jgi:hypothetical protein